MKFTHIIDAIGNTPLVPLKKLFPHQNVWAKLEGQNPGGSVKDRTAKYMILQAIKRGELPKQKIILEATSGNMGISLSMIGTSLGFRVQIIMSEGVSMERRQILKAMGAELILTKKELGTLGAVQLAKTMVQKSPQKYWFANQFENFDNIRAHEKEIAPEIFSEISPDIIIGGIGTSGTMSGIARFTKKNFPRTKIYGVVPPAGFRVQGIQNPYQDFFPKIFQKKGFDNIFSVSEEESITFLKKLAQKEGIFAGMSSGAVLSGIKRIPFSQKKKNIVVILPDRGEKYLSTGLFNS